MTSSIVVITEEPRGQERLNQIHVDMRFGSYRCLLSIYPKLNQVFVVSGDPIADEWATQVAQQAIEGRVKGIVIGGSWEVVRDINDYLAIRQRIESVS